MNKINFKTTNPLVVIPARGGSKGLPGKNIKDLSGKPLIQYTIDEALKIFNEDLVCVSTDDLKIKEVVEKGGLKVPFIRPAGLAKDTSGTYEVLLHAVNFYKEKGYTVDVLILLQPTSPFRKSNQIEEALELYKKKEDIDMVISVKETTSNPYYVLCEENNKGFLETSKKGNFKRRQDCPKVYEYNGAIYIINVKRLLEKNISEFEKKVKYVMNEESSLDIDNPFDFKLAEVMMNQQE